MAGMAGRGIGPAGLSWRGLGYFWLVVGLAVGGGAAMLAWLGPPAPLPRPWLAAARQGWPEPSRLREPKAIRAPDPMLLEPAPDFPGSFLPRIGPAGHTPAGAYAAAAAPQDGRPRVGLILAGLGLDRGDSLAANADLPPAVSFAVSPYTQDPQSLLERMRAAGHETLLTLPMEPDGYPGNDEGARQLLTGATLQQNYVSLEWALSRVQGYAGVMGGLHGERFAASPALMAGLWSTLNDRGLFYIDSRPGAGPPQRVPGRGVEAVIEPDEEAGAIDRKLAALEQAARRSKAALGLAGRPSPVAIERIAAWAAGLPSRGVVLVPASALVRR